MVVIVVVVVMVAVVVVAEVVLVVIAVTMSDDMLGYWQWSIIHCMRVIRCRKPQLVSCKPVVLVVVLVVVVVKV